ncbi:hypothetical protein AVEN_196363-1 [Araneus ventricosus]|uniref:Uncharacterized protein n=1 Tax=Araneus ventricosus TaxID=182803 RepID=A0A4Y2AWQ5_ARAVE|nr:hypothetical protein AVEN_196363-1 [Araneus ventricosus]
MFEIRVQRQLKPSNDILKKRENSILLDSHRSDNHERDKIAKYLKKTRLDTGGRAWVYPEGLHVRDPTPSKIHGVG